MIPKLIENADSIQVDLLDEATQTRATRPAGAPRPVGDDRKDWEEGRGRQTGGQGDRYERQEDGAADVVDFSETLRRASLAWVPEYREDPGQLLFPGMGLDDTARRAYFALALRPAPPEQLYLPGLAPVRPPGPGAAREEGRSPNLDLEV